jgi:WD40 repeat protein
VSGSSDNTLKLWNVSSGKSIKTLKGYSDVDYSVCFFKDEKFLASGSFDRTLKMWNVSTGECIKTLEGHSDGV